MAALQQTTYKEIDRLTPYFQSSRASRQDYICVEVEQVVVVVGKRKLDGGGGLGFIVGIGRGHS